MGEASRHPWRHARLERGRGRIAVSPTAVCFYPLSRQRRQLPLIAIKGSLAYAEHWDLSKQAGGRRPPLQLLPMPCRGRPLGARLHIILIMCHAELVEASLPRSGKAGRSSAILFACAKVLAAARSRRGSYSPPGCNSLPRTPFALLTTHSTRCARSG